MAWISVDQKLMGAKLRTLYKAIGCSKSEAIGILITLWLWGLDNCDMDGLIPSAEPGDIAEMLETGIADNLDPEMVVHQLIECGWIDEQDGGLYLHDWSDWRSYYNSYMNRKKNHAEYMRGKRSKSRSDSECDSHSDSHSDHHSELTVSITKEISSDTPQKSATEKYGADFENFWEQYPRKADKGACFKKYKARIKDGYSPDELLTAAQNYRLQCERDHTDQKYIKHGKTFLGESLSFTDYLPGKATGAVQQAPRVIPDGVNPFR